MCLSHLIYTVRPCLIRTCHAHAMLRPCRSSQGHSTAVERRPCCGLEKNGMASVNQTRPYCVNRMGKTHSKPLTARHGRGMLCVNRPLTSYIVSLLLGRKLQAWGLAGDEPKNFSTWGSLCAATVTNQLTTAYRSFFSLRHSLVLSQFPTSSLRFTYSFLFLLPNLYSFRIPILSLYLFLSLPLLCFSLFFLPLYPFDVLSKFSAFVFPSFPILLAFPLPSFHFPPPPHTCHLRCFDIPFVVSLFLPFFFLLNILSPFPFILTFIFLYFLFCHNPLRSFPLIFIYSIVPFQLHKIKFVICTKTR